MAEPVVKQRAPTKTSARFYAKAREGFGGYHNGIKKRPSLPIHHIFEENCKKLLLRLAKSVIYIKTIDRIVMLNSL